jgi:DNA-binding protein HU-beta
MNKSDLIEAVQAIRVKNAKPGETVLKKDVEADVNGVFAAIGDALVDGDKICIVGFGTIEPKERAERKGRAPQSKKDIIIPAQMTAVLHPGKSLKENLQVLIGKGF